MITLGYREERSIEETSSSDTGMILPLPKVRVEN